MYYSELVNVMSLLLSSLAGFATLFIAYQLSIIGNVYKSEARTKRLERTLNAIQLPENITRTMSEVIYWHYTGKINTSSEDFPYEKAYVTLNFLETLATGIRSGVYDEDIAYARLGDSITNFYPAIERFIYESRSSHVATSLYVQLERLARDWSERDGFSYSIRNDGGKR